MCCINLFDNISMIFPIQSDISPVPYGPVNIATSLKIDGNAGDIPPYFAFSILTKDGVLCQQAISRMRDEQWAKWTSQSDASYILQCVADNEGFTLVASK